MAKGNLFGNYIPHIEKAIAKGRSQNGSHSYRFIQGTGGSYLLFYVQGMLMSVWHREGGLVEHTPIVWEQDENTYRPLQKKFEQAVRAMKGGNTHG
jgi:hypothetical protein